MQDFILTYPFNGFPFIPQKVPNYDGYHAWSLTRAEAMKLYWLSDISDLSVNISVVITEAGFDPVYVTKNYSNFTRTFMDEYTPLPAEPSARSVFFVGYSMYRFYENDEDPFEFFISPPIYINDDCYEIRFHGEYSFEYDLNIFLLRLGFDSYDETYIAKYDFTFSIYGREIPCSLIQRSGRNYGDEMQMTASASANSSYII